MKVKGPPKCEGPWGNAAALNRTGITDASQDDLESSKVQISFGKPNSRKQESPL